MTIVDTINDVASAATVRDVKAYAPTITAPIRRSRVRNLKPCDTAFGGKAGGVRGAPPLAAGDLGAAFAGFRFLAKTIS